MRDFACRLVLVALLFSAVFTNVPVKGAELIKRHTLAVSTAAVTPAPSPATPPRTDVGDEDWTPEQKGKMDADRFYDGWRQGRTWTLVTTALFGGILGLIPAIAISTTPPKPANLGYPNDSLMKNERYKAAYERQAKKIKSRKVWGGFGIGLIIAVVVVVIVNGA